MFVHLHRHSEFSRLDGLGTAKQYAEEAARLGQYALAQTDHGTLSGALHHIIACQNAPDSKGNTPRKGDPIIPISGVEAYYRPNRLLAKKFKLRPAWHLCLFAKNLTGWHNLLKIVSTAYAEPEDGGGFYDKPCVDMELLTRHREGIAASSACISSWLSHLIDAGDSVEVTGYLNQMLNIFGDDFWIEIMPHDFDEQRTLNIELVRLAQEKSIPLLATNDAHFPYKEWSDTQRIVKMMAGYSMKKVERLKQEGGDEAKEYLTHETPTLYLAAEAEMKKWFFQHHPDLDKHAVREAMENTSLFVQRMQPYVLGRSHKLPKVVETPAEAERILRDWMEEGLGRIAARGVDDFAAYEERAETEFALLKKKGVLDYFVMVGEITRWCKEQGIRVGLGRGSAAGCLVSYLIGITQIDPIAYGLLFERFLNPDRKGLPDIDLDFQSDRRSEVKDDFIKPRYGADHVADIITHTTFQPKKVLQDLCRVFDDQISYAEAMLVTNTIEIRQDDEETTLEELVPINDKLKEFSTKYPEIWKHALRLEGQVANAGKHAAGIIITPNAVSEYMALERGKKGDPVTSWSDAADFPVVSDYGFVKLDALGITGLEKHEYACRLIEERTGEKVDLYDLGALYSPYVIDAEVMQGFCDGHTVGVFQFGGRGITNLLREIQPDDILDLAAANALYRPGPMKGGVHRDYARRKQDEALRTYWHPLVEPVLRETYGIVAYQEQVMEIAKQLGGFTAAQADDMRKAMGKLYRIKGGTAAKDFMRRFEEQWFAGCEERGIDRQTADEIWHKILEFGHYGFNKSHSASYALQAYQDMWLKMKYPAEFYAAFLTYEDDEDKRKQALREAKSRGIEIVLPDVNTSGAGYTVDDDGRLLLGLISIKGVGERAAEQVISKRPFKSFDDFLQRAGRDADTKALLESGALDKIARKSFVDRAWLMSVVTKVGTKSDAEWAVWEHLKHNVKLKKPREVPESRREPSADALLRLQAARLNMPATSIHMDPAQHMILERNIHTPEELAEMPKKNRAIVGGEISKVIRKKTKKGKEFANVFIVFEYYEWTVKFWEPELLRFQTILSEGRVIMVEGAKDDWNGNVSVVASYAAPIEEVIEMQETEEEAA